MVGSRCSLGCPVRSESGPTPFARPFGPHCSLTLAGVTAPAGDKARRERLCRYVTRPAFASEQVERLADGRVRFELRRPRASQETHLVAAPDILSSRRTSHVLWVVRSTGLPAETRLADPSASPPRTHVSRRARACGEMAKSSGAGARHLGPVSPPPAGAGHGDVTARDRAPARRAAAVTEGSTVLGDADEAGLRARCARVRALWGAHAGHRRDPGVGPDTPRALAPRARSGDAETPPRTCSTRDRALAGGLNRRPGDLRPGTRTRGRARPPRAPGVSPPPPGP